MILVRIKRDDEHVGLRRNEVYVARPCRKDPGRKVTLMYRLPDMFRPMYNESWRNVRELGKFRPVKGWEAKESPPKNRRQG